MKTFWADALKDAKEAQEYDKMTEDKKKEFDAEQEKLVEARNKYIKDFKAAAKLTDDNCKLDCQSKFEKELYKWEKDRYDLCKANKSQIECREAEKIKLKEETARAAGDKNYYVDMTADDITEFKKTWDEESKKEASSLAAAWIKNNVPKDGEVGSACNEETIPAQCTSPTHCCGTATPKQGAFVKEKKTLCAIRNRAVYEDQLGEEFTFLCQEMAKTIAATAATAGALVYSLM